MIKQHCDICDGVIPNTEAYRTIHFGRGTNANINIGYDPMTICKRCWKKMLDAVKPEAYIENIDAISRPNQSDDIIGDIVSNIIATKTCKNCLNGDCGIDSEPCKSCLNCAKWEEKTSEN